MHDAWNISFSVVNSWQTSDAAQGMFEGIDQRVMNDVLESMAQPIAESSDIFSNALNKALARRAEHSATPYAVQGPASTSAVHVPATQAPAIEPNAPIRKPSAEIAKSDKDEQVSEEMDEDDEDDA